MLDTKKLTDQEVEILLDSLDFYEKLKNSDEMEYSKMREAAEVIESQLKRQISEQNIDDKDGIGSILQGINNYKKEMLQRERDAILNKKINREKITLLKAKLILLQQEKAIDSVFKNN